MQELNLNQIEVVSGGAPKDPCQMSAGDFTILVGLSIVGGLTAAFSGGLATAGMALAFGSHVNSILEKNDQCRAALKN